MPCFVQLSQTQTTINLDAISDVDWETKPAEIGGLIYTTTVTMQGGGGILITELDARQLWQEITRYNQKVWRALGALPAIIEALDRLAAPLGSEEAEVEPHHPATPTNPTSSPSRNSNIGSGVGVGVESPTTTAASSAVGVSPAGVRVSKGRVAQSQAPNVGAGVVSGAARR